MKFLVGIFGVPFTFQFVHQISIAYTPTLLNFDNSFFFIIVIFFYFLPLGGGWWFQILKFAYLLTWFHPSLKFKNEETYCIGISRNFPTPFPDPWCSTRDRSHDHPGFCRNSPPSTTTWSCERGVDVTPTADSLSRTLWRSLSRCIRARVSFGNSLPPIHRLKIHI